MGRMRASRLRRTAFFLVAAGLALGAAAFSACKKDDGGAALVVSPDPIEFGDVRWGESPTKTVRVTNRSSRAVTLKDPEFNCSCFSTVRPADRSRLEPGDSVELEVVLFSAKTQGTTHKTMSIRSDDPVRPKTDVPVRANVLPLRTIEPQEADFGLVEAKEAAERVIRVRSTRGFHVRVLRAVPKPPARPVDVSVRPAEGGEEGNDVVLRTRAGERGLLSGPVTLEMEITDDAGVKRTVHEDVWIKGEVR
jgi:hypothetical protein